MNYSEANKSSSKNTCWSYLSIGKNPGKVPELDGLRAWAILLVLGHHFVTFYAELHGSYYRHVISGGLENWLQNGWLGVDLFFVLSGYLIFHHLMSVDQQTHTLSDSSRSNAYWRYGLKRILRTFPLYYAMILIAFLGIIPKFQPDISSTELVIHLLFLQDYAGTNILSPMWSLATEEKFYLLAPLLLILTRKSLKIGVSILLVSMLGLITFRTLAIIQFEQVEGHIQFFVHYRSPFHFAVVSILVGVMVALLEHKKAHLKLSLLSKLVVIVIFAMLLSYNFYHVTHWQWLSVTHFIMVLLFGFVVWSAVKYSGNGWLKMLTGRFLRVISVLSYSFYLVHYAVLPWVYSLHKQYIYSETPWIHAVSFLLIYIGLTVLVGLVLHYLVEKPFLVIKERL